MQQDFSISDAELELMKVLWRSTEAISAQQASEQLSDKQWKYSTIATLFGRLVDKGAVTYEKKGRFFYYSPTIDEDTYKASQTKSFLGKLYDGSVKNLVASLVDSRSLSQQELDELKCLFNLQ